MSVAKDLDFLGTMKLVNYVRREVRNGHPSPHVYSKSAFEDDQYLKPTLEDDALLYTLEDAIGEIEIRKGSFANGDKMDDHHCSATERVAELETELKLVHQGFAEYQAMLEARWVNPFLSDASPFISSGVDSKANNGGFAFKDDDSHYFNSYSYNGESTRSLKLSRTFHTKPVKTSMRPC